jgi:hypothetical protein
LANHIIIWQNPKSYYFPTDLGSEIRQTLTRFPDTHLIILKLTLLTNPGTHANMIIYDVIKGQIERFDPYGMVPFIDQQEIDSVLELRFRECMSEIEYIPLSKTKNTISFQIFSDETADSNYLDNDPKGFCMAWCIWYTEMRFKNPGLNPDILIRKCIVQINKSVTKFKDYIRNYSNYLDYCKHGILNEAGVPKKWWYSLNIPRAIYQKYRKYMHNRFQRLLNHG